MVTCVGGATVPALLERLRVDSYFEYRIIGVDSNGAGFADELIDAFYVVPKGNGPDYINVVCEVVERESVHAILPGSDEEALSLARCREQLKHSARVH